MSKTIYVLIAILSFNIALANDVRLAEMGGEELSIRDIEYDCFNQPVYLTDQSSKIIIGGICLGIFDPPNTDLKYAWGTQYSKYGVNTTVGVIIPPTKTKTSLAVKCATDFGNNYKIARDYAVINLRAAQQVGIIRIGFGYDRMFDDDFEYDGVVFGLAIGKPSNRISSYYNYSKVSLGYTRYSIDLIWMKQLCRWLGLGVKGLTIWDTGSYDDYSEIMMGLNVDIPQFNTKLYGEGSIREFKFQNGLIDSIFQQNYCFSSGSTGLETWVKPNCALRAGLSLTMPSKILLPQTDDVGYAMVTVSCGTTVKIFEKVNFTYAYNWMQSILNLLDDRDFYYYTHTSHSLRFAFNI